MVAGLALVAIAGMLVASLLAALVRPGAPLLTPLFLFVVVSLGFVNAGFVTYWLQGAAVPWEQTAVLSVTYGVVLVAVGGAVGTAYGRSKWRSVASVAPGGSYRDSVVCGVFTLGMVATYFVLLGEVPLISGLLDFLESGFRPGLVNAYRIGRDVYVNPDAKYIPLQGLLEAFRYFGLPMVAVSFLHFYRCGIRRRTSLCFIIVCCLFSVAAGQRWPLMYLFAALITYWSWTERSASRFKRALIRALGIAIGAGVLLSALLGRTLQSDLGVFDMAIFGADDLARRILYGNSYVPYLSYSVYGVREEFLYGASWLQNLAAYLPGPLPSFPVTFSYVVLGSRDGSTSPPDFYTELFINFGGIGLAVGSLVWGFVLGRLGRWLMRAHWTAHTIGIGTTLVVMIAFSAMAGISLVISGFVVAIAISGVRLAFQVLAPDRKKDLVPPRVRKRR